MTEDTKKALKRYENLMLEKRGIENELEQIKEEILPDMPRGSKVATADGVFTVESRTKWVYSRETRIAETTLKETKEREQQDGTAKPTDGAPFLVYRQGNEE